MPCKVDYADLESVTKFLDKIKMKDSKEFTFSDAVIANKLSKMIKDKYTEIKPDYERKN